MLITLSRRTAICQSVAEVQLTGLAPLGAVSHRFNLIYLILIPLNIFLIENLFVISLFLFVRYTAITVLEMDFDRIDINQCPKGLGNNGPNHFADTARCKKDTTEVSNFLFQIII